MLVINDCFWLNTYNNQYNKVYQYIFASMILKKNILR